MTENKSHMQGHILSPTGTGTLRDSFAEDKVCLQHHCHGAAGHKWGFFSHIRATAHPAPWAVLPYKEVWTGCCCFSMGICCSSQGRDFRSGNSPQFGEEDNRVRLILS